jgi:hypothetical protein
MIPRSTWSVADFTVTFPDGWTVQYGHGFAQHHDQPNEFGFYGVVVDEIFSDACRGKGGASTSVGPGVDALVTALLEQDGGTVKTKPVHTTLGGYPATRIDLRIANRVDLDTCQTAEYGFWGLQVCERWSPRCEPAIVSAGIALDEGPLHAGVGVVPGAGVVVADRPGGAARVRDGGQDVGDGQVGVG